MAQQWTIQRHFSINTYSLGLLDCPHVQQICQSQLLISNNTIITMLCWVNTSHIFKQSLWNIHCKNHPTSMVQSYHIVRQKQTQWWLTQIWTKTRKLHSLSDRIPQWTSGQNYSIEYSYLMSLYIQQRHLHMLSSNLRGMKLDQELWNLLENKKS